MRWAIITQALALSLASVSCAAPSETLDKRTPDSKDVSGVEKDAFGKLIKPSTFNDQEVPPLADLNGELLDKTISQGHWLVEFFSPYCSHCKAFAPTLQTVYETYYTSYPELALDSSPPTGETKASFTKYYDFHFGRVDCVASGSACKDKEIQSFPTVALYKDGKFVKKSVGAKSLTEMSEWLEEALEGIKPGSRPKKGLKLPKVGANHTPDFGVKQPKKEAAKDTKDAKDAKVAKKLVHTEQNSDGRSVALTAESFLSKVTTTRDPWFIKFYAPWCPHCQAMQPTWQAVARDMKDKMNIGEVNCDVEKHLCKDVHVRGYPTLVFFQAGERIEYEGLRGLGDLLSFANKAAAAGQVVKNVNATEFEIMEKTEDVIFLYLYDHATTSEDFEALERLTLSLIGHAVLVKSNDEILYKRFKVSTWPRLLVSRDGKPTYYPPFTPRDMRDFRKLLGWMKSVWQPIVAELTSANAKEIMANKLVVLGILSRDRGDEFIIAKREIKNAALEWIDKQTQAFQLERQELRDAKQLRIEEAEDRNDQRALRNAKSIRINMDDIERKEVAFAWVDGVFWERWIKTTYGLNVKEGERVVVNDEENHRYWDTTSTGNPIVPSRTSILETLPKIVANPPKLSPKTTASFFGHIFFSLRNAFSARPVLFVGAFALLFIVTVVYARGVNARRNAAATTATGGSGATFNDKSWGKTGGFFQLPVTTKEGTLGGLLGSGGAAEKAD